MLCWGSGLLKYAYMVQVYCLHESNQTLLVSSVTYLKQCLPTVIVHWESPSWLCPNKISSTKLGAKKQTNRTTMAPSPGADFGATEVTMEMSMSSEVEKE